MPAGDFPIMANSTYTSNAFALNAGGGLQALGGGGALGALNAGNLRGAVLGQPVNAHALPAQLQALAKQEVSMSSRRLVKVVIVDPNENVPLENCVLYSGEEKLTDATDQELFFEIDIKAVLEAHNKKRVTFIDKKVKERTEHLEPAKIRDLKMVVVNIASF